MWIHNNEKEEWINEIKYMSPRPRYNHTVIAGEVYFQFKNYFNKNCTVAIEGALFLTKLNIDDIKSDINKLNTLIKSKKAELAPDIAVYCDKNQRFYRGFLGVPQLIVEVLSPSNSDDDTITKKDLYEEYGVPEYWIISPMNKKIRVFSLINEKYELTSECSISDNVFSTRFNDLSVNLSEVELIEDDF
ncbi:MAG: Uma2 family endonuclease [Clostridium sp.]